jgi:hypothetical protein
MPAHPPILALDNVSVATSAGISGLGFCSIRLLDRVSLTIAASELLLLRGGYDHGSATLLKVIAGDNRFGKRITGDRVAAPGLVVRKGCVPASAIPPLVHCWTADSPLDVRYPRNGQSRQAAPLLVLLRTTHRNASREFDINQWLLWCVQLRKRGGTMVVAERTLPSEERDRYSLQVALPSTTAVQPVYENIGAPLWTDAAAYQPTRVSENHRRCPCSRPAVRILQFGFGRLFREEAHAARLCRACREGSARAQ